jgi:alkylhydroperoxidase family enzyme
MPNVTARMKGVFKPSDYPGTPDAETKKALTDLFEHMFPGNPNPEMGGPSGGFALVAQNPQLALHLLKLSGFVVKELPWAQRKDLRELAVQTLNLHHKCEFSFQSHMPYARDAGISLEQQAALPYWKTTNVFNEEQKMVIEYTHAVLDSEVTDELFARVVKAYGEKGAMELTTVIAWWSFWAFILNAAKPVFDFGNGPKK